jgi:hypothetical protein
MSYSGLFQVSFLLCIPRDAQHNTSSPVTALAEFVGEVRLGQRKCLGERDFDLLQSLSLFASTLRFEPIGGSVVASQKTMRLGVIRITA